MAKIMKIEKSEYQGGRLINTGIIGQNENGPSMASADYISCGGVAHRPEKGEKCVIIPINPNRYYVALGCETLVELNQGESAFFCVKNGQVQSAIIAKDDGNIEINGNRDNAVLYSPLKQFAEDLKIWLNTHTHANHGMPPATLFTGELNAKSEKVKLS